MRHDNTPRGIPIAPLIAVTERKVRIAAVGDLHYRNGTDGKFRAAFSEISDAADILLLCGDIIDYGLPDEARLLMKDISETAKRITIIAVLGNHEYESGKIDEVINILKGGGITILDGEAYEAKGVGFAGVKGFLGGFGKRVLAPWGEPIIKQFVHEAVEEALKLESALARLRTQSRVALIALCADRRHRHRRAARDLPFPRLQPLGRADQPLSSHRRFSRARPQRHSRRQNQQRRTGLQRRA